jgi:hypothetical protein
VQYRCEVVEEAKDETNILLSDHPAQCGKLDWYKDFLTTPIPSNALCGLTRKQCEVACDTRFDCWGFGYWEKKPSGYEKTCII